MPITTISLQTDEVVPAPVQGATVEFYNTSGAFQTSGVTGSDGSVTVTLPAASYDILMFKVGMTVLPKQPQRIAVLTQVPPNAFRVTVHIRSLPESTTPGLCRVSGYFIDSHGRPQKGVKMTLGPLKEVVDIFQRIVDPDHLVDVTTDENGYLEFDLLRKIQYEAYFPYKTMWKGVSPGQLVLTVPDAASVLLDYLLFPVPARVEFSTSTVNTTVGGRDDTSTIDITYTDGNHRQIALLWGTYQLVISDASIFNYEVAGDKLIIIGLAPGTATLTVTRTLGDAHWDPEPPFEADVLTVVVS